MGKGSAFVCDGQSDQMAGSASSGTELVIFQFEDVDGAGERVAHSLKHADLVDQSKNADGRFILPSLRVLFGL